MPDPRRLPHWLATPLVGAGYVLVTSLDDVDDAARALEAHGYHLTYALAAFDETGAPVHPVPTARAG